MSTEVLELLLDLLDDMQDDLEELRFYFYDLKKVKEEGQE